MIVKIISYYIIFIRRNGGDRYKTRTRSELLFILSRRISIVPFIFLNGSTTARNITKYFPRISVYGLYILNRINNNDDDDDDDKYANIIIGKTPRRRRFVGRTDTPDSTRHRRIIYRRVRGIRQRSSTSNDFAYNFVVFA